jgi:hypothetical protein
MPRAPQFAIGRYWGKVTHQRLGETSTGNYQLILSFQILGMVNLSDPEGDLLSCPQGERSFYRVLTESTIDFAKQDMNSLGWYGSKWSQFDEENTECFSIIGKEYAFYCKHEPRNVKDEQTGKWVATSELKEVWGIAQAGGPQVKPLDNQKAKALDAMFGRALKDRKAPKDSVQKESPLRPQKPANGGPKPVNQMTQEEVNAEIGQADDESIPF